jgi:hypothetical protein
MPGIAPVGKRFFYFKIFGKKKPLPKNNRRYTDEVKAAERWRTSIHMDLRLRQPPVQFRRLHRRQ